MFSINSFDHCLVNQIVLLLTFSVKEHCKKEYTLVFTNFSRTWSMTWTRSLRNLGIHYLVVYAYLRWMFWCRRQRRITALSSCCHGKVEGKHAIQDKSELSNPVHMRDEKSDTNHSKSEKKLISMSSMQSNILSLNKKDGGALGIFFVEKKCPNLRNI